MEYFAKIWWPKVLKTSTRRRGGEGFLRFRLWQGFVLRPSRDHATVFHHRVVADPKHLAALGLHGKNATQATIFLVALDHGRNMGAGRETQVVNAHLQQLLAGVA